jgi:hypothetical protein
VAIICHNDELSSLFTDLGIHESLENGNNKNFEKDLAIFCKYDKKF